MKTKEYSEKEIDRLPLNKDQLLTIGDLDAFKKELLLEITKLLNERASPNTKKWLKSTDVRKILSISSGTLQNLRVTGKLPYSKVGGLVFYKLEDVEYLLSSNATT